MNHKIGVAIKKEEGILKKDKSNMISNFTFAGNNSSNKIRKNDIKVREIIHPQIH